MVRIGSVISVAALPMSIWPQAMSYARPSSDVDLVRPVTACFAAVYGAESGRGTLAEIEPLLMIRPPRGDWRFMMRNASCVQRNVPVRLVSTHGRPLLERRGPRAARRARRCPALLNSRSSRPNRSSISAKSAATDSGSRTSQVTATAPAPASAAAALERFQAPSREDDREARARERDRRRPADAAARARDQRDARHRPDRRARPRRRRGRSPRSSPRRGSRARVRGARRTVAASRRRSA